MLEFNEEEYNLIQNAFIDGYLSGFRKSGEGYNGEWPEDATHSESFMKALEERAKEYMWNYGDY